jgi:hypothetical protein
VGEDVTANVRTIRSVPLSITPVTGMPDVFEVRGEVYFPIAAFEKLKVPPQAFDKIVKEQRYYPPEVYDVVPDADGQIAGAMKTANARYHYVKRRGASDKVLRLLRDFMGALADLMTNPSALPPAPLPVASLKAAP